MIVKFTTAWNENYSKFLMDNDNSNKSIEFKINDATSICDYWVIWGGIKKEETVLCPPENIFYITDEAHEMRFYNQEFLNQFSSIYAVRDDLEHRSIIKIHEPQIWYFNQSFDELAFLKPIQKSKKISVVCSDLTWLQGHKNRFSFVNKLIGHFKDKIDVYGRGFNPLEDKWEALAPYQFSIAIENNQIPNYFTEKISECFLAYTVPVYFGCPNVHQYYHSNAFIDIDIFNYKRSFETIEQIIDTPNLYNQYFENVKNARDSYFQNYFLFEWLKKILPQTNSTKRELIKIKPEFYFKEKEDMSSLYKKYGKKKIFFGLIESYFK